MAWPVKNRRSLEQCPRCDRAIFGGDVSFFISAMTRWSGLSLAMIFWVVASGCSTASPTQVLTNPLTSAPEIAYIYAEQLWVYDTDTARHYALETGGSASHPALLPDGQAVLYVQPIMADAEITYYELWEYTFTDQSARLLAIHKAEPRHIQIAPNGQYITYIVDAVLYLTTIKDATAIRLHEGATASAWSPNSRRVVYSTLDDRLLAREFSVTGVLGEASTLVEQAATAPVFSSNQTLLFAGVAEGGETVLAYQFSDASVAPLISLYFTTPGQPVRLQLDPVGKQRILYERIDTTTGQTVIWLLHLKKDVSKQLLSDASGAVWSDTANEIYYQTLSPPSVSSVAATGLNTTTFVTGGSAVTTVSTLGSNDMTE